MSTAQEIKEAAEAAIAAKDAVESANAALLAATTTAVTAAQLTPEYTTFVAAINAYEAILEAERNNAGVPALAAALSAATATREEAVINLTLATSSYDGL